MHASNDNFLEGRTAPPADIRLSLTQARVLLIHALFLTVQLTFLMTFPIAILSVWTPDNMFQSRTYTWSEVGCRSSSCGKLATATTTVC
jgi:hypothetical protein